MNKIVYLLPVLALTAAGAGCGKGKGPVATYPVSGQVLYDGKPAVGVKVYFYPTSAPTVPAIPMNPHGITGADGRFTLTTYTDADGAPEGGYQVVLLWTSDSPEEEASVDQLMGWHDTVHSKLTAKVKPGENVLLPFHLSAVTAPPRGRHRHPRTQLSA